MGNYLKSGYLEKEDIIESFPTLEDIKKHPVAVSECIQEIPCNPCVSACPVSAISMEGINGIPQIDFSKCTGCGKCVSVCPGLALFLVGVKNGKGLVTLPYEMLNVPSKGEKAALLDRKGQEVGIGTVERVIFPDKNTKSALITVTFDDIELIKTVRNIKPREK
jgi:Fe-S-cluster-containing hydrogenase component 2